MALPDLMLDKGRLLALSPHDLLMAIENTDQKITRTEQIPLDKIVIEGTPIDDNHARDLGIILMGEWGQTQAIALRCRAGGSSENDVVYDVMDGYHRVRGLSLVSDDPNPRIKSEVYYNCSDAELYDQRILAANSVKAVQFARLGYWMRGAWDQTPWKNKISVAQAFSLAATNSSGKILGLTQEESEEIKEWANLKADKWLIPTVTVAHNLKIIEISDQLLVSRVRAGSFGKGQLAITPTQLETIATAFPGEGETQRLIAAHANSRGLSNVKIEILTKRLEGLSVEDVKQTLEKENWEQVFKEHSEIAEHRNGKDGKSITVSKGTLRSEVISLNEKLIQANQTIDTLRGLLVDAQDNEWWKPVNDLSDTERAILQAVFIKNMSTEDIADKLSTSGNHISQILLSGIRKYQIYKEDLPFKITSHISEPATLS